jgi:hypothetical protein
MPVRFDQNGNGFHIPTALYHAHGYIPHPLQILGVSPMMPWFQHATKIPANIQPIRPNGLIPNPPAITIKR